MLTVTTRRLALLTVLLVPALSASLTLGQESTEEPVRLTSQQDAERPGEVERYEPLFFSLDIDSAAYTNPFDPADIEISGIFEAPDGEQFIIPGFWMQPYEDVCQQPCQVEDLQPVGEPQWQIRFTPEQVGTWSYTLQIRNEGTVEVAENGTFRVRASDRRGFIRIAPNQRYFQYSNGLPYFAIGHDLDWSWAEGGGLYAYQDWLDSLTASGGNYARLVIDAPWFIGLEWDTLGDYRESQDDAARLDMILSMAGERGIALQLVLLWSQALRTYSGPPVLIPDEPARPDASADWDDNPYNSAHRGPITSPSGFFNDSDAETLFQRRLRYIVARWGYSPQVFAWELIDQIDQASVSDEATGEQWLGDMASYLKQIDEQGHLVTAGSREFSPSLAANPLLDFTELRYFQRLPVERTGEHELNIIDDVRWARALNNRPVLLTAHSLNPWFEPAADDPTGVHFQNALWAAVMSGAGGGAMSAWGENYVIRQGLERYYAPLAAFASGLDWARLDLQPAEAALLSTTNDYPAVRLTDFNREFLLPLEATGMLQITADGAFPALGNLSSFLYGQRFNNQMPHGHTFRVTAPITTYLEVSVRNVSIQSFARLAIMVDGVSVSEARLASGSRNISLRVPLASGEHTVALTNTGEDWLELEYVEIGNLMAPARALTLRDTRAGVALAWLQHRDYTWDRVAAGITSEPVELTYRLEGMPPGRYVVQQWNPLTGAVLGEDALHVNADGVLTVNLLPLSRQLAIRAIRQSETPPVIASPVPRLTLTPTAETTVEPTLEPTLEPTIEPTLEASAQATPLPSTPTRRPTLDLAPLAFTNTPNPVSEPSSETIEINS